MSRVSRGIDRIDVTFDEPNLVADAGLLLVGTPAARLGLERLVDTTVRLAGRVGGARPGRKVLTLVHAIVAGGSHIDHADVLRSGGAGRVLPHRVMAPSTLGTFLRAFTFGHVRQLEAVVGEVLRRAWAAGAGPGPSRLVVDLDSTICEVAGRRKQGAAFGYTKVLGYHPLLATRAETGEVLQARMRKGSADTSRGARRFVEELVARVRRAGASGEIVMRFDSGFWSNDTIATLGRLGVRYTMAVRTGDRAVTAAIAGIDEGEWRDIDYTPDGEAQVAECTHVSGRDDGRVERRLVVRRTRLTDTAQARLWPEWRHFAFLADLHGDAVELDAFHREHAVVELAIRDLKEGAGMEHVPSGNFSANGAWLQCAVLAHNLVRWTSRSDGRARSTGSRRPAPCAPASSPSPDVSSTGPGHSSCAAPPTGPGRSGSACDSTHCAPSNRKRAETTAAAGRAADGDQRRRPGDHKKSWSSASPVPVPTASRARVCHRLDPITSSEVDRWIEA